MHPRRLRCSSLAYDEYASFLTPCRRGASRLRCLAEGSGSLFQQEVGRGPSPWALLVASIDASVSSLVLT